MRTRSSTARPSAMPRWRGSETILPSLRGAERRSNPFFLSAARWIASRSLSSGAHSRDPVARNDDYSNSTSLKHRLALLDKGLHGFAMVRRRRQADQARGFVVAGGGEIEQQGFVEIVLHVAQRQRRPLGHRFRQRKGFLLKLVVRHHAVEEADPLASLGIDLLG